MSGFFRRGGSWLGLSVGAVLMFFGCGDDAAKKPKTEPAPMVCTPGTSYSCVKGTCNGRQHCLRDGSGYTACMCTGQGGADAGASDAEVFDAEVPGDAATGLDAATGDAGGQGELCGNGEDDDADGDVDCEDDECGAHACVAAAPSGFSGPVALYVGEETPSECVPELSVVSLRAGAQAEGDPAECSSCTCEAPGAGCSAFLDFATYAQAGCGGSKCTTSISASCVELQTPCTLGVTSGSLRSELPSAAVSCTPSTQTPTKPPASFATRVLGCARVDPVQGGCDAGELCLPKAPDAFEETLCVWKAGDVACEGDTYTDKRLFFRDLLDTRGCSACSCDDPECSYRWDVFAAGDSACATPLVSLSAPGQCVSTSPVDGALRVGATLTGDGACAASGGQPEGSVSGVDPVTVCCEP